MTNADKKLGYDSGDKTTVARIKTFASQNGALIGLIILCIALSIVAPAFLSASNLMNVGIQAATVAILAFGQTFVIVAAGIDLSVGATAAVASMLVAYTGANMGLPAGVTIIVGLLAGAVFGALSGMMNAFLRLPSFIATLAMMSVARGLTLVISDGRPISTSGMVNFFGGTIIGIPVPIIMMVIMGIIASVILNFTTIGRSMYAVGGNMEASRLSGISVHKTQIMVFVLSGIFAAVAWSLQAVCIPPSRRRQMDMRWTPLLPLSSAVRPFLEAKVRFPALSSVPFCWPSFVTV